MTRVLIVEDSPTAAFLIKSILESDKDIQVIATAGDGTEGLNLVKKYKPDLVTMDIHLPGMNGFETTRLIMEQSPCPIVIVSGSNNARAIELSFEALKVGALIVFEKPPGPGSKSFNEYSKRFIKNIKMMSEIKVVGQRYKARSDVVITIKERPKHNVDVIAVAASTGGPAVLLKLFSALPHDFSIPILVVQHISAGFENGLVNWLSNTTGRQIVLAEHGSQVNGGTIAVSPIGVHMGLNTDRRIVLDSETQPIGSFKPSANYLFESVAKTCGRCTAGVVLTGMGTDGVNGLRTLYGAGGVVIAQDEQSSVVYGMPGAAVQAGIVHHQLSIDMMAELFIDFMKGTV